MPKLNYEKNINNKRIGTPVYDGEKTFKYYQWRDGKIFNLISEKFIVVSSLNGYPIYHLFDGNRFLTRSLDILTRHSFPERFTPSNIQNWIDVFGYEDEYCFNPQNPIQVFSKRNLQLLKLGKNNNRASTHLLFNVSRNSKHKTKFVHVMVWQSYNKKNIPDGYVCHHINHDSYSNQIQNLILLPKEEHTKFEIYYNIYTHKNEFYKNSLTKEQFYQKIESLNLDQNTKEILKRSI